MNNNYIQLSFKMYECQDCGEVSVAVLFEEPPKECDNCEGRTLIELEETEKSNE